MAIGLHVGKSKYSRVAQSKLPAVCCLGCPFCGATGLSLPAAVGCVDQVLLGLPVVSSMYLSKSFYQGEDLDVCSCKIFMEKKNSEDLIL